MSVKNTLTALVAGVAIGAVGGLMLAPASGDRTRKKLMKRGDKLCNRLTDLIGQGKEAVDDAEKSARSAANKGGKAVNDTMDKAKDSYEQAKGAYRA
ncbi:MAG: YtxH domain-containing protein [Flavobacteriales bacterium]